jgi:hypothetical protein
MESKVQGVHVVPAPYLWGWYLILVRHPVSVEGGISRVGWEDMLLRCCRRGMTLMATAQPSGYSVSIEPRWSLC